MFLVLMKSLLRNRRQSLLTLLSMAVAVFSVLMISAIGAEVKYNMEHTMNVDKQQKATIYYAAMNQASGGFQPLDVELVKTLPDVLDAHLTNNGYGFSQIATVGDNISPITFNSIAGAKSENFAGQLQAKILAGKGLDSIDQVHHQNILIDNMVMTTLFNHSRYDEVIGQLVTINGSQYTISGVFEVKLLNNDLPSVLVSEQAIPLMTSFTPDYNQMNLVIKNPEVVPKLIQLLQQNGYHHQQGRYMILDVGNLNAQFVDIIGIFVGFLKVAAAISMLVAGIGVMNAMYSSVANKRTEIGVRRALGATRTDILLQFLLEGTILTLVGGFIGLLLSLLYVAYSALDQGHATLSMNDVLFALGIPIVIGITFSYLPASIASRQNTTELIR